MTEEYAYEARVKKRFRPEKRTEMIKIFHKEKTRYFYGYPTLANEQIRKQTNSVAQNVRSCYGVKKFITEHTKACLPKCTKRHRVSS
jgi:hypothetical protein